MIGTTSRPDLLDAALLRPGRLDRLVYCGFPTAAERLAILRAAARRLALADGVDFEELAERTDGYTGELLAGCRHVSTHALSSTQQATGPTADWRVSSSAGSRAQRGSAGTSCPAEAAGIAGYCT